MNETDPSNFPDIEIPKNLTAPPDPGAQNLGVQNLVFPFCLTFNGQPWQTIPVAAPSVQAAALTVDQLVRTLNATAVRLGYPPNCISAASGACN